MSTEDVPAGPAATHKRKQSKKRQRGRRSVPQRTCVGCRTVFPKREMLRVVRTPEDVVAIDLSGKQAGRGAYLCRKKSCWETALKRHSLDNALKTTLDDSIKASLITFAQKLTEDSGVLPPVSGEENR